MNYIKRKSQKQEKRTAKEFGGRTTPASGALDGAKGDVRTGTRNGSSFNESDFLIENKFTDKDYYKLDLKIWEKIEKEALRDNMRTPIMQIDIQDVSFVLMSYNDYSVMKIEEDSGAFIATDKKSMRLDKTELETYLDESVCIGITFVNAKLVIMKKDYFLDLLEE